MGFDSIICLTVLNKNRIHWTHSKERLVPNTQKHFKDLKPFVLYCNLYVLYAVCISYMNSLHFSLLFPFQWLLHIFILLTEPAGKTLMPQWSMIMRTYSRVNNYLATAFYFIFVKKDKNEYYYQDSSVTRLICFVHKK